MEIRIISVGKIRERFYKDGIEEYLKRLGVYTRVRLVEGLEERISPRARPPELEGARRKEGERVLALVKDNEILIALDGGGFSVSSEGLAELIDHLRKTGKTRLNLVVGGATGLSESVKKRADTVLSLSALTFPHQMAVLIIAEQLYRSFTILASHPYHK